VETSQPVKRKEQQTVTHLRKGDTAPAIGVKHRKVFGLPVDHGIMFSNYKQRYKPRVEKRQRKLIIKIPFLRPWNPAKP